jgi:Flp pilus assembly pilin Flp
MKKRKGSTNHWKKRESGASLLEFTLLVLFLALAGLAAVESLGLTLKECNENMADEIARLGEEVVVMGHWEDGFFIPDTPIGTTSSTMCRPTKPKK